MYLVLASAVLVFLTRAITAQIAFKKTYTEADVPSRRIAIVFGAGLWRDGSPTPILQDRVETGARLFFAGKVEKILMTGDNSLVEYNEPEAMRQYAIQLGVPDTAIVLDYAGRRTYDSCYRAKEIFRVKEAILITQKFHLARALFLCNALGLDGIGVEANNRNYMKSSLFFWNFRELPATLTAFADVLSRPLPILGDPEPIFPENTNDSQ
ncbi:MAG: YdcF family protein [Chloroflexi bacterium]|nr:YdcF family protein [Chloroflexota bacterium]